MNVKPIIELDKINYSYENFTALANISLKINPGEFIFLVGPNGSGKSTLFKLLNGLIFPQSGKYLFDGEEINERSLKNTLFVKKFHKRLGYVFQNPDVQLFNPTVYDEIAFGPRQMNLPDEEITARVKSLLEFLNIEHLTNRAPYHLSGGEQKKVAIAAVLALNPDVIIMDEPLNGLDNKSRNWVKSFLQEFSKAGKTLLIATHEQELLSLDHSREIIFTENHTIA